MKKTKSGFTLVEILIVVVILGILAAIVIPQFTDAATQAKESSLKTDLQAIRSQIELYKIQHTDALPDAAGTDANFVECMTGETDMDGDQWAAGAGTVYGAYMQSIPENPYNGLRTVRTAASGTPGSGSGWMYDSADGTFYADCDDGDANHLEW